MSRGSSAGLVTLALAAIVLSGASFASASPREVKISATDAMQYSLQRIEAKPGEQLEIVLTAIGVMPKSEMAHNWVLLAKGADAEAVVMAGAMARKTDYIPAGKADQILAHTALAGAGESVEVTFTAPKEPGDYTFLCTFPGHYAAGMRGVLAVR